MKTKQTLDETFQLKKKMERHFEREKERTKFKDPEKSKQEHYTRETIRRGG